MLHRKRALVARAPPGQQEPSRSPRRHGRSTSHTGQIRCGTERFFLVPKPVIGCDRGLPSSRRHAKGRPTFVVQPLGVAPPLPIRDHQNTASKPATPASAIVGMSGSEGARVVEDTARALTFPSAINCSTGRRSTNIKGTCPPTAAYAIRQSDPTSARELHRRAIQLNPNSVMALIGTAWNETLLSNSPEAIELLRRAERISPRDPRAWVMAAAAANAHLMNGQFKEAVSLAEKALAFNPRSRRTLRILAVSLAGLESRRRRPMSCARSWPPSPD